MATPPATAPALVWFRRDLRLADNPALNAAVRSGRPLLMVFIRESDPAARLSMGAAADWWLHHSLKALAESIEKLGGTLVLREGEAETLIPELARQSGAAEVYWNRLDWPWLDARDDRIARALEAEGRRPRGFRTATLVAPGGLLNGSGRPYKVFTPFWRAALKTLDPACPQPAPERIAAADPVGSEALDDWNLLPRNPDWASNFSARWTPGEAMARRQLEAFSGERLNGYKARRDRPDLFGTSRLSPHIGWGEISLRTIWHRARLQAERGHAYGDAEKFLAEIGWRDFAYYLVHHFGDLRTENFDSRFDRFPWRDNGAGLKAWQRGRTGVPMVDAAMRELWSTGWMHNRARMVAASYLVKHIGCDWRAGMAWFEDTLVDADPLVNAVSWQWVAGSGADASPYFRIFNPATQGRTFDPDGRYVRRWVPEVADLPTRHIHAPWEAATHTGYPRPVADLGTGREAALAAFEQMKRDSAAPAGD